MTEIIENALQVSVAALCLAFAVSRSVRTKKREWILLCFFYGSWVLADLYWESFLVLLKRTPGVFYVSEFSWYASYIFLFLLLKQTLPQEKGGKKPVLPWLGAAFAAAMCVFYVRWGDYAENVICALLMGLLLYDAIRGLTSLRGGERKRLVFLCAAVIFFCAAEYALWTASCFWEGDSIANPYYWADALLTVSFVPLLFAVRRAVKE